MRLVPGWFDAHLWCITGKSGYFARPIALILIVLMATACFGRQNEEPILGSDQTLSGEAILVCGQACSERAQCGMTEQHETVLLSSTSPTTVDFNMAVASGTSVLIVQQQMAPVVQVSNQESQRVSFYQVDIPDVGAGWVAGWCISQ